MFEFIRHITDLLGAIAWPATTLIIVFILRAPFLDLLTLLRSGPLGRGRNVRFRMGSFELETKIEEQLKETEKLVADAKPNAVIVNWYQPVFEEADAKTLRQLGALGLIAYPGYWGEADEIAWITPRGLKVLESIRHENREDA